MRLSLYIGRMYEFVIVCHVFDSFSDVQRAFKVISFLNMKRDSIGMSHHVSVCVFEALEIEPTTLYV